MYCAAHTVCCWQHLHVFPPVAAKWYRAIVNLHSCVVALTQRDEEVYHPWGAWRDASPAHLKEPSEVAQHLYQMSPGCLPQEVFWSWEETMGKVQDTLEWYVTRLAWECLGILPKEQEELSREREVWVSLLSPDNVPDWWKGRKKQVEVRCG